MLDDAFAFTKQGIFENTDKWLKLDPGDRMPRDSPERICYADLPGYTTSSGS